MCMHTRTRTYLHYTHTQHQTKHQKRRNKISDAFECVLLYIIPFGAPSHRGRKQGVWSRVWCDTLLKLFFVCKTSNMQAHLSRSLKPSLILWRPKYSNFFQQTSSQLALDCQWGSPNSKIYHLETHKRPLREIFPFKASWKEKKKNSVYPFPLLFMLFWHTRKKTDVNFLRYSASSFPNEQKTNPCTPTDDSCSPRWKSGTQLKDFEK